MLCRNQLRREQRTELRTSPLKEYLLFFKCPTFWGRSFCHYLVKEQVGRYTHQARHFTLFMVFGADLIYGKTTFPAKFNRHFIVCNVLIAEKIKYFDSS